MKKEAKKIILFTDDADLYEQLNADEINERLKEADADINDDDARLNEAYSLINCEADDLNDALKHYDKNVNYDYIIVVADFGLWYGRRQAQKQYKTLKEAVSRCYFAFNTLYFKRKNSTLNLEAVHHDGRNYYKFYKVVNNKKRAITYNEIVEHYFY